MNKKYLHVRAWLFGFVGKAYVVEGDKRLIVYVPKGTALMTRDFLYERMPGNVLTSVGEMTWWHRFLCFFRPIVWRMG